MDRTKSVPCKAICLTKNFICGMIGFSHRGGDSVENADFRPPWKERSRRGSAVGVRWSPPLASRRDARDARPCIPSGCTGCTGCKGCTGCTGGQRTPGHGRGVHCLRRGGWGWGVHCLHGKQCNPHSALLCNATPSMARGGHRTPASNATPQLAERGTIYVVLAATI